MLIHLRPVLLRAATTAAEPGTVTINEGAAATIAVGETLELTASLTGGDGTVTWSSSAEGVATVGATGPLAATATAVAEGVCVITATPGGGGTPDSLTLTVEAGVVAPPLPPVIVSLEEGAEVRGPFALSWT